MGSSLVPPISPSEGTISQLNPADERRCPGRGACTRAHAQASSLLRESEAAYPVDEHIHVERGDRSCFQEKTKTEERLPVITGKEFPVGPYYWPYSTLDISKTKSLLGMKNYVKWQDCSLPVDTVDDLLRVEKGFSGLPRKMRDQREDRVDKPHKWKKLGLRHGLVDAARQSRVLFRVHVGESGDLAKID